MEFLIALVLVVLGYAVWIWVRGPVCAYPKRGPHSEEDAE